MKNMVKKRKLLELFLLAQPETKVSKLAVRGFGKKDFSEFL